MITLNLVQKKKRHDIDRRFTYHPPKDGQPEKYSVIRDLAKSYAILLLAECPDSAELSIAIQKIEESVMWANASIARWGE